MVWGKAGSTTLAAAGDDITVTAGTTSVWNTFMYHGFFTGSGTVQHATRFDGLATNIYTSRFFEDNLGDVTQAGTTGMNISPTAPSVAEDVFHVGYVCSFAGNDKLYIGNTIFNSTTGNWMPSRSQIVAKSIDTTALDKVSVVNSTSGSDFAVGSNVSVLGSDMTTSEGRPTDVQAGSRWEETDTRKVYHYGAESPIETLDSTNGTTGWNVTNGGSDITIDTSNNEIDITGTGEKSGYYDLGASVSASSWLLRFKITSSGSPTGNPLFWVGMFDVNTIGSRNTNVDGISLMIYTGSTYKLSMKNGTHMDSGGSQTDTSPTVSADTTTRYVEIVRNGSNAILTFYNSDTYITSIGTCTVAITGSAFRYLCAISYWEGSGRTYSLSNVKFYNGTTTTVIPNAWTEEGT